MAVAESAANMNTVALIGRLGAKVEAKKLPSGAVITTFHVTVDRNPLDRGSTVTVDVIACVCTHKRLSDRIRRMAPGTQIRVAGSLRRRFWRGGTGLASATEVHVREVAVVHEVK
ncbi:MAG: hypothetical protein RJB01_1486 [Actinomycetota bacterium]|jgi:single-strand DNA-binding protein